MVRLKRFHLRKIKRESVYAAGRRVGSATSRSVRGGYERYKRHKEGELSRNMQEYEREKYAYRAAKYRLARERAEAALAGYSVRSGIKRRVRAPFTVQVPGAMQQMPSGKKRLKRKRRRHSRRMRNEFGGGFF